MIIESIPELKNISRKTENAICVVSGFVSAMLLAFNGYMWSQSVIVEVYPFSVLSLMGVICLLMRWLYAPHQRRYLYFAWLLFGICFTNHQTLIVAAMGIEVLVLAVQPKLGRDLFLWNSVVYVIGTFVLAFHWLGTFEPNDMVKIIFHFVGVGSILTCGWYALQTKQLGTEALPAAAMLALWLVGAAFYLYMPITSMTNPPLNWGYPRTVEGFIHALTRGQYEKTNPTNFLKDPTRLVMQIGMYFSGANDEFNIVTLLLALIPFFFFLRVQRRERAWMIGLTAIWSCLAILLLILLNPQPDKASVELNRVFFTSSYTAVCIFIGLGLTLTAAYMSTQYDKFRIWGIAGGGAAAALALWSLVETTQSTYGDMPHLKGIQLFFYAIKKSFATDQYGLPVYAGLILLGLAVIFMLINTVSQRKPLTTVALAVFAMLPLHSVLSHWSDNEERGHLFGFWFGHDMFTPPVFTKDGNSSYDPKVRAEAMKSPNGNLVYPEMTRDAVLFGGTDPGRFCPTYMIFCQSFIPPRCKPTDPLFDRRDVYIITQNALADGTYLEYIRAHYNRSTQKDPPFFQELLRLPKEKEYNFNTNFVARLAYQLMDRPFLSWGAHVEAKRRAEGVYPKNEIYTPTPEDSQQCFQEYLADAQRRLDHDMRLQHDMQFPTEPRQMHPGEDPNREIKPGEDVKVVENRVQVSGQIAVMSINGLLTKVIFDHNPTNEFFVEESFPLDWMYPYLTPFGIIMKINRQPVPEFTEDIVKRDHEFWSEYSRRLIGNWITYDTSVKQIADFIEKVYVQRDFSGFTGDRKFIRDDQGQKAFSKLRSSIGGIYNWRIANAKTPAEQQRMIKEADFTFRQAFAFCPYSPEAVFRYVQLLAQFNRFDDAILIAETCLKLDPHNGSVSQLLDQLKGLKAQHANFPAPTNAPQVTLEQLEQQTKSHPDDFQASFNLAMGYVQTGQKEKALQILDGVLANPKVNPDAVLVVARVYNEMHDFPRLENALQKLTQLQPASPEAWYDLAAMEAARDKTNEAMNSLRHSMTSNAQRLAQDPKASNLLLTARGDDRFAKLRQSPEFQQLLGFK
jgi:thioredoxin-like negative regulator of GroEL